VRGRFCAACGALAREAPCASCGSTVAPGEKFCGECGLGVGPAANRAPITVSDDWRPSTGWKVGTAALAALLLVTLYLRFGAKRAEAPTTAAAIGAPIGAMQSGLPAGAGPLSMAPQQQADALFDRVMRLNEEGKRDSVQFFAPMAMAVYESLQPLDADQRFDLGLVALVSGAHVVAGAQADSILQKDPSHLLGLVLQGRAARARGQIDVATAADRRLVTVGEAELAKSAQKTEYQRHRADIENELKRMVAEAKK